MVKNKSLRIAILSVHSSPLGQPGIGDTGGMSIYIRELTQELVNQGHSVDIFTRSRNPGTPEIIPLGSHARLIDMEVGEPADIDKLLIYSYAPDFACKTANYCKVHDLHYDAIFSHYWISGISGLYLQTWWQVPHVIMFHTLGAIKNDIGIGEDEPELRIEEEGLIARQVDRIIASTEREKTSLNEYYSVPMEKISVIPCGVNLKHFRIGDKIAARKKLALGEEKVILFVGRIERLKGIDKVIQALPMLSGLKPKLLIVGEDGNRKGEADNLKVLARDLGVSDSVTFSGLVDYDKLPDYYNAADVCVFPSYYESFGLVPLESLACGTPVIATNVGDLENIIQQNKTGFVLKDNHPEHLAEKLQIILSGKSHVGSRAYLRTSVARFGWQHIAGDIFKELNKLVSKPKAESLTK
jgi:D-inositol-3-phosphate glycosyltransferase